MGYRSGVVLAVSKEIMPHFLAALSRERNAADLVFNEHDDLIKDYEGDGNLLIRWNGIKWYDEEPPIAAIMKFVADPLSFGPAPDGGVDAEDCFRFVRIGEEPEDCEYHGYGFDIHVNRTIDY